MQISVNVESKNLEGLTLKPITDLQEMLGSAFILSDGNFSSANK